MSQQTDQLSQEVADAQAAETSLATRVQSQIDALNKQISDLESHPAAPDISTQIAGLKQVVDGLNGLFPAPASGGDTAQQTGAAKK